MSTFHLSFRINEKSWDSIAACEVEDHSKLKQSVLSALLSIASSLTENTDKCDASILAKDDSGEVVLESKITVEAVHRNAGEQGVFAH